MAAKTKASTKATTKATKTKATKETKVKATKETKVKPAKGAKAGAKAKAKSNIPVIVRPRSINPETFALYMESVFANSTYRKGELEAMHEADKCPHKAIQSLSALEKELSYISKRLGPMLRRHRRPSSKENNILMKNVDVSPELAKFLGLKKGQQISRSTVNRAITTYVNVKDMANPKPGQEEWIKRLNPGGKRNLQSPEDRSVIVPDKALNQLLGYDAYVKRVAGGKEFRFQKNKETRERTRVKVTSPELTYSVLQHLLAAHYPKSDVAETAAAPARRGRKAAEPVADDESVEVSDEVSGSEVADDE